MADGTLLVQVPVDDGAIQSAFELLDAQMDAWLQAMQRAERALAARAIIRSAAPGAPCEPPTQEPAELATPVCTSEPVIAAAQSLQVADTPAAVAPGEQIASEVASVEIPECTETIAAVEPSKPAAAPPVRQGITPAQEIPPAEQPAPTAVGPGLNKHAEDDALLASLDEETAKAIRVMRRMCMNTKSVRELLAEYQAKKGIGDAASAATAKKSWFRRK